MYKVYVSVAPVFGARVLRLTDHLTSENIVRILWIEDSNSDIQNALFNEIQKNDTYYKTIGIICCPRTKINSDSLYAVLEFYLANFKTMGYDKIVAELKALDYAT